MTVYAVMLHTDSSKPETTDQRLSVIRWKTPSKEKNNPSYKKPASRCVSIPKTTISAIPEILSASLQLAFEDMQDEVIRDHVEKEVSAGHENITITDDMFSPDAVAAYQTAKAVSGRLSGDSLTAWFDEYLDEPLSLALANVMSIPSENPTAEQLSSLTKAVEQHKTIIVSLASPRAALNEKIATQLKKAVTIANDDGRIKQQLLTKLDTFLQPKEFTLAINL
jgi:hypothetical protein